MTMTVAIAAHHHTRGNPMHFNLSGRAGPERLRNLLPYPEGAPGRTPPVRVYETIFDFLDTVIVANEYGIETTVRKQNDALNAGKTRQNTNEIQHLKAK